MKYSLFGIFTAAVSFFSASIANACDKTNASSFNISHNSALAEWCFQNTPSPWLSPVPSGFTRRSSWSPFSQPEITQGDAFAYGGSRSDGNSGVAIDSVAFERLFVSDSLNIINPRDDSPELVDAIFLGHSWREFAPAAMTIRLDVWFEGESAYTNLLTIAGHAINYRNGGYAPSTDRSIEVRIRNPRPVRFVRLRATGLAGEEFNSTKNLILRRKQSFSVGSELSETLTGSSFNDQIIGLGGRDTMLGNGGSDTFVYLQASESPQGSTNRDRVLDFGSDDWLDLSNIQSNCSTVQFATLAVATNNIAGCTVATYQNSSNTLTFVIGNFTPSFGAAGLQIELAGSHAIQVGQNLILDRNRSALQSYVDTGDPFLN